MISSQLFQQRLPLLFGGLCLIAMAAMFLELNKGGYSNTPPSSWDEVWQRKGAAAEEPHSIEDLAVIAGFGSVKNYRVILDSYRKWMEPFPANGTGVLCDIGCGPGAFIRVLPRFQTMLCVDLASSLLRVSAAYTHDAGGNPYLHLVRDVTDLWGIPADYCDVTTVNSILEYMPSVEARTKAIAETIRITKGRAFYFDLRDGSKTEYSEIRKSLGIPPSNHHFVEQQFWAANYPGTRLANLTQIEPRAEEFWGYNARFSYSAIVSKSDVRRNGA